MHLKIKTDHELLRNLYTNLSHNYEGDSGMDIYTPERHVIPPGAISYKVNLEISCEAFTSTDKDVPTSFYLYPRSSTGSKTPLRLSNSVGIIDSGYRGNLLAIVDNVDVTRECIIES